MANLLITLQMLVQMILERIEDDFDVMIVITGETGTGKSNLALQLYKLISDIKKLIFDLSKDIAWNSDSTIEWINEHNNGEVLIIDEAVNVAFHLDFQTTQNKQLAKILDIMRSRNLITIWNLPNFKNLMLHGRNRCKIWLYVEKRGLAHVFLAKKNPAISDKFQLALLEKIWFSGEYNKHPAYRGYLRFEKISDEIEKEYNKLKNEARDKIEKAELKKNKNPELCEMCNARHWQFSKTTKLQTCRSCGFERIPPHMRDNSAPHIEKVLDI